MGEETRIAWTDHTFNPVWGCEKISPGCENCYAEKVAKRTGHGVAWLGSYRVFGEKHWKEPITWDRKAREAGERKRVFCGSMCDVFDVRWPEGIRERLFKLIRRTPSLDWLLLTKRIGNAKRLLPQHWPEDYRNVAIGATVVNQDEADRDLAKLQWLPAAWRFLSIEPLLGRIDLANACDCGHYCDPDPEGETYWEGHHDHPFMTAGINTGIDWVIVGGESGGPEERRLVEHKKLSRAKWAWRPKPQALEWVRTIRDQCQVAGVPFFFKQWGGPKPDSGGRMLDGREWLEFPNFKGGHHGA
jgi:protein gp37